MKAISEAPVPQSAVPQVMPANFTVSIPLDDLRISSAFSEYPNSLFANPIISLTKYYSTNKDELLSSGQDKFWIIDLFFRNWNLTFQYTNMFTQIGCTVDLITGIRAEELTPSGLMNLVCDIQPVTVSVRNYIITAITANISGYKASQECLNRVRQFQSTHPFVVPAQRIESWVFPSGAALTGLRTSYNTTLSHVTDMCLIFPKDPRYLTYFENPCNQNMQVSILSRSFPDFPMNTLNEQFFTMQQQANNLVNRFEACDEYEESFATPRGTATRRYNPASDYIPFFITIQYERNSNGTLSFDGLDTKNQNTSVEQRGQLIFNGAVDTYYNNVETNGKHPPPPVLYQVHDTFLLFTPTNGGSCDCDTTHSFDEVIREVTA
ncbi:MAG: hypothetical protein EZS28_025943 [Streblomastix strix]|uniref:Uncharacterized protein n=1 Tax=Streblomastix strix TaxID=222440 RepID=A0A5J4V843_9EUKA|nr:MAG: hypothetical protein EZS28_025943 [Streblomastix strix]